MALRTRLLVAGIGVAIVAGAGPALAQGSPGPAPQPAGGFPHTSHVHTTNDGKSEATVCAAPTSGDSVTCLAHVRTDAAARGARPAAAGGMSPAGSYGDNGGYGPAYLQSAYNLTSAAAAAGADQVVAIVAAYDDPTAESDLATYRSTFGLPACGSSTGCFRKVNQRGGTAMPAADGSWGLEIALDVDMVSAVCPRCRLLLVEADSNTMADLGAAENTAAALGATVISNSWGGWEYPGEAQDSSAYFNHPGVAITVASGDAGYGVNYPAASSLVTAVGGTTLAQLTSSGTRDATETAWSGAGSGCSAYEPKPSWQRDSGCAGRSVADVSAVADPATGVWAYYTYAGSGWGILGGTSAAAPIVAGTFALAGSTGTGPRAAAPYAAAAGALNDITSGSNGSCATAYLCNAGSGYDGPTGLGTASGVSGFAASTTTGGTTTTAPAPPSAPQGLTAVAGNASAQLTWTAVSGATDYNVYRGTSAGSETLLSAHVTSPSYGDAGLTNGTSYYYRVTAVASTGESAPSTETSARPATVASAPQSLTAKGQSGGVQLSWKAPTSNGGSAISGYQVLRSRTSGTASSYATSSCTATTCSFLDTATTSGSSYYYQVVAVNGAGAGARSAEVSAKSR